MDGMGARTLRPRGGALLRREFQALFSLPVLVIAGGCPRGPHPPNAAAQSETLALLMPSRIEIVEPFTRVRSFDDDDTSDGIGVLLRAVNSLGDSGLRIVGTIRVDLFEFVPASANKKGARVEQWTVDLGDMAQQQKYWNRLTQMYELRLGVNRSAIPKAGRYVLAVTCTSPFGEHLTDEYVLEDLRAAPGT